MTGMHIRRSAKYQGNPWRLAEIRMESHAVISECKQWQATSSLRDVKCAEHGVTDVGGPEKPFCRTITIAMLAL